MITKTQRKYLKAFASQMEISEHIGKEGITENLIAQLSRNLTANEICKIKVLPNSMLESKEILQDIALKLDAEPVQAIGRIVILYKYNPTKKKHILDGIK